MTKESTICFSGRQTKKGSVLIFTLFIMMITLVIGISLMATSLSGRRSTLSSGKSINAFQIADSGLEATLVMIKNVVEPGTNTLNSVFDCTDDNEFENNDISGGEYSVTFWDGADPSVKLDCDTNYISDISRIKSVGSYRGTTRSIETSLTTTP